VAEAPSAPAAAAAHDPARPPLLRVEGLKKHFPIKGGFLKRTVGQVKAVDDVSFTVHDGEILSLVGESGCGKTTTARAVLRAVKPTAGKVLFRWANVTLLFTPGQGIFLFPTWVGSEMKPPSGGHAIEIIRHLDGDNTSNAFIDADTAAILVENITLEDRILMDSVLETRRVSPLDRSTAPWPYNGEPGPTAVRLQSSRISFIHPALETGLHVYQGAGDPGPDVERGAGDRSC